MADVTIEYKERMCTNAQSAKIGSKLSSCELLPREFLDVLDAVTPSKLAATGHYIDSQIDRNSLKAFVKITPVCHKNSKPALEVKLGKLHIGKTRHTLTFSSM